MRPRHPGLALRGSAHCAEHLRVRKRRWRASLAMTRGRALSCCAAARPGWLRRDTSRCRDAIFTAGSIGVLADGAGAWPATANRPRGGKAKICAEPEACGEPERFVVIVRLLRRARNQTSARRSSEFVGTNIMLCPLFVRHASQKISAWLQYVQLCICLVRAHSRSGEFAALPLRLPSKWSCESTGTQNA